MTRRVRSGNTQKHKKMPGEATKWGEFDLQKSIKSPPEEPKKILNEPVLKQSDISDRVEKNDGTVSDFPDGENSDLTESCVIHEDLKTCSNTGSAHLTTPAVKLNTSPDKICSLDSSIEESSKNHTISNEMIERNNEKDDSQPNGQQNEEKPNEKRKKMYLKKLQQKRAENGITLLSSKAERKLYVIKKKLRQKGVPPDILKNIIRKERRKEEVKFCKINDPSKLCFLCRQPGHFLAGCPQKLGSSNQETGLCFKCGSYNHTSLRCPKKVQGFPFAKCFICKEQGHISKDCPRNQRGVYPKGGRCNLCGNINHLRKDCPSMRKEVVETEEPTITLHTIMKETSVDDDDVVVVKRENRKATVNKPKIVKF